MKSGNKIYHVHFYEPVNDKYDYYFGSLSAVYTVFTTEQIGCGLTSLWSNAKITETTPYVGRRCTIACGEIIRKTSNRGRTIV